MSKRPSKLARSVANARKFLAHSDRTVTRDIYVKSLDPAAPVLPPLLVGIYREGKLVKVEPLADPRIVFCQSFNEQSAEFGVEARPAPDYAATILAGDAKGGAR